MLIVRKIKDGFKCDMCFQKPDFEICGDNRYADLPAFHLCLCKGHAKQLAENVLSAIDMKEFPEEGE